MIEIKLTTDGGDMAHCAQLMNSSEPFITLGFTYERCLAAMKGDNKEIYLAYYDGEFAGFVVLQLAGVLRGYIQTICVVHGLRGKGIGTALLEFSIGRVIKMSPHVFMCVSSFNHGAQKLYARMGFVKVGEFKDHLVNGYDEYLLRKSVGSHFEYVPPMD